MSAKVSTEDFIKKASIVHSNKYDYSASIYTKAKEKITIICPEHGKFMQQAADHLNGSGCRECRKTKLSSILAHTTDIFITKAQTVHGKKYDYSKVVYKNNHTKVDIICKEHGVFSMAPLNHLSQQQGCPTCGNITRTNKNTKLLSTFIKQANLVHANKYDYSKSIYTKDASPIVITCPIHGEFTKTANGHLAGQGCPSCSKYGFDRNSPGILYYLSINNGQAYKIGITNRTVEERFLVSDLQKIEVVQYWHYDKAEKALNKETKIKQLCKNYRYTGTNLLSSGNTELFNINILKEIKDVKKIIEMAE